MSPRPSTIRLGALALLLLLSGSARLRSQTRGIVINELMSRNEATLADADGDFTDWIEIHNAGPTTSNLQGYMLSDQSTSWTFPSVSLRVNRHLVVFASGKDRSGGELHTNFKIRSGETVVLYDASGRTVDRALVPPLREDMSYARTPNGSRTWRFLDEPTPGAPNPNEGFRGFIPRPRFSPKGGFYSGQLLVELEASSPLTEIRYTLDGSDPSESLADGRTFLYSGPIRVTETTVIGARSFEPGMIPSRTATETFLIDFDNHGLPVLSISAAGESIYDEEDGLLAADAGEDEEREVHVTFFEPDGRRGFDLDAGLRLHGRSSRFYPQSSWAIFARDRYGPKEIDYRIFGDKALSTFEAFLVRNNGQDHANSLIRNAFCSAAVSDLQVDRLAHRAAIVFVNGRYQGVQHLSEKINEHYVASNHPGVSPDSLDLLDGFTRPIHGDNSDYLALKKLVENPGDRTEDELYDAIRGHVDLESYYDYVSTQLYFDNRDWTGLNEKLWRTRDEAGRWRWILFDLDAIALDPDSIKFRSRSADFFQQFMTVGRIRNEFLVTLCNHLNSTFLEDRLRGILQDRYLEIRDEMPRHIDRWKDVTEGPLGHPFRPLTTLEEWESNVDVLRDFVDRRGPGLRGVLAELFGGGEDNPRLRISIQPVFGGSVDVSGLGVDGGGTSWEGSYVHGLTLTLRALPSEGFAFSHWARPEGDEVATTIVETLLADRELGAVFLAVEELGEFIRGDANGSGTVDISDAVAILRFLFLDRGVVSCLDAADADDNGLLDITDAINILVHLFIDARLVIPPPYPSPGVDRSPDDLRCAE